MSLHINRFVDAIKAAESRGQRDLTMTIRDARDLHADITKLLFTLTELHERKSVENEPIQIELAGGSFKTPS
jgi:hypothetical protein